MILSDTWFSTMAENDHSQPMFIAGRDDISDFIDSGKFKERFEIYWRYEPQHNGMPSNEEGTLIDEVTNLLKSVMEKDKLAILTGIYTGAGERTLVFYTRTAKVLGERLNDCLAKYPVLPLTLYVEKDPQWNEYREMLEIKPYAE